MENRIIKKLIDNLSEEEILTLEELLFFQENIPELDSETMFKINTKSRDRFNSIKLKNKISFGKIIGNIAVMLCIVIFCGSVVMLVIEKGYSYTSKESELLPYTENMSVLEHIITVNEEDKYRSLQSVIWSERDNAIFTTLEGEGTLPSVEASILINDEIINSSSYCLSNGDGSWRLGNMFKVDFKHNEDDKITYILKDDNGEEMSFNVNLVKSQSEFNYSDIGPSNVKEGIAIIGTINEKDDILDVNFTSVVEGKDAEVIKYSEELASDGLASNIVLTDANGNEVIGKEVYHGNRFNNFQFDTKDLTKPYKIHIQKVTLGIYDINRNSEVVRLPLPKDEKIELDKDIKLSGNNYIGMDNNRSVKIVDIEKIDDKSYGINVEFPKNIENNIKISTLRVNPVSNIIDNKKDFIGYGEELDKNNILKKIIIETTNNNEKYIRLDIKPKYYIVEGNWELYLHN